MFVDEKDEICQYVVNKIILIGYRVKLRVRETNDREQLLRKQLLRESNPIRKTEKTRIVKNRLSIK